MIRRHFVALGLLGCSCLLSATSICAQAPSATPSPTGSSSPDASSASPANANPPHKVWTNDDVKQAGSISVVGDKRNQKYTMSKKPDNGAAAPYRTKLKKLQAQLADVNKKLQSFQDFQQGKPVSEGSRDMSVGYKRTPVDQQIVQLQDKKKSLQDQIDALYDEARKKGIEAAQLDQP